MCCIFTCFGWALDLVQRCWTFAMSWMISSAICCFTMTASMSGVALGYNYSLAEYIELKETNVSVYLKRGVFDDEVVDEMDWRRSGGGGPVPNSQDNEPQVARRAEQPPPLPPRMQSPENDDMPVRSGRRLDDSLFLSDDAHRFEGSLIKLTAKPFDLAAITHPTQYTELEKIAGLYSEGSVDNSKAIQSLINSRRKMDYGTTSEKVYSKYMFEGMEDGVPLGPPPVPQGVGRRVFETPSTPIPINPLRLLVPGREKEKPRPDDYLPPPGPKPIQLYLPTMTPTPEDLIRNRVIELEKKRATGTTASATSKAAEEDRSDSESKDDLSILKTLNEPEGKDYEDDEIKGLPLRKRRSLTNFVKVTSFNNKSEGTVTNTEEEIKDKENKIISEPIQHNLEDKVTGIFKNIHNVIATESMVDPILDQIEYIKNLKKPLSKEFENTLLVTTGSYIGSRSTKTYMMKLIN